MAGSAVHQASMRLREQIVALAAVRFEASPADITLEDGAAFVHGVPDRRCSLREIARSPGGRSKRSIVTRPPGQSARSVSISLWSVWT